MTSTEDMKEFVSDMVSSYGVWSSGYNVKCGARSRSAIEKRWNKGDDVTLTLDCDNKKISIENKRINWCHVLDINLRSCPFPWKFFIVIKGYQLRIKNDF